MNRGRVPLFRSLIDCLREAHVANATGEGNWSRRGFLQTLGAAGMAGALSGCVTVPPAGKNLRGPVVIVGGGIAGLTAALRLMQQGVDCELYEASPRFGGRMFTKRDFNRDGMFCELGGELVDTNHEALIKLAKECGISTQPLKKGEKGLDFYHIGGKIFTDRDLIPAFQPMAKRIAADAEGLTDAQEEYTAKAKRLDGINLKSYLAGSRHDTPAWLIEMLDVAYCCEYGVDTVHQSALNLVNFIGTDTKEGFEMFGTSDESMRIEGGNDRVPTAVYGRIQRKVRTFSEHELSAVARTKTGLRLTFRHGSQRVVKDAAHVICAIPFTVLRHVEGIDSLGLSAEKKRAIHTFGYGANVKVMWGVKERVWRQESGGRDFYCNGSVVSDLPFQQFWETSRGQKGRSGILTNFIGGTPAANWTAERLKAFPGEAEKVFPALAGQWDGNRAVMNWPKVKWNRGSYSATLVGQYTWAYAASATQELGGALVFAGEHTSPDFGGFMNGGVESGERAAKEVLAAAV
ncbi:FAD-dependent oxidoreductase [Luteolibacter ambystomatis]|uniref:FAD-dependent oxidoreductase n=1 Tax=Luteolibacter ambystomatis TaxID=2824561 RepID=A0A975G7I6_9BACT|nr:NAD(P)/FAD-dependent oxidoreductase [Luteolibacter ambystomatis]QUE50201.1 FAD-dependent oxidoreductase [Luteolibacter ambystomatis]